jgi:hypothetical protein
MINRLTTPACRQAGTRMIIAFSQNLSRHCDDLASGERRSNLKRSTIQGRKEIASSANPQYNLISSQ